jgi:hypothetical protein
MEIREVVECGRCLLAGEVVMILRMGLGGGEIGMRGKHECIRSRSIIA